MKRPKRPRSLRISPAVSGVERLAADKKRKSEFHVYAGYAGWAPRQLEAEIARGDWLLVPADAETVFSERPGRVWPTLVPPEENPYVTRLHP